MDNGSKMFLGVVLGSLATKFFMSPKASEMATEGCVHAYYADKYNAVPRGSPSSTFITCMEAQNREMFKKIKAQYAPAEANAHE